MSVEHSWGISQVARSYDFRLVHSGCQSQLDIGNWQMLLTNDKDPHPHTATAIQCCGEVGHPGKHWAERDQFESSLGEGQTIETIANHPFTLTWDDEVTP